MPRETLVLILPILWALVSAGIALLLYKSSKTLLEGLTIPGLPTKGLRVAGSAAIFIVAFLLLKSATPGDVIVLSSADFEAMRENARQVENGAVLLRQCSRRDETLASCGQQVQAIRTAATSLKDRIEAVRPASARN